MDSEAYINEGLEEVKATISVEGNDENPEDKKVELIFPEVELGRIQLSEKSTNSLQSFYEKVFEYIVENKTLLKFVFEKPDELNEDDLYVESSSGLIDSINEEIEKSRPDFEKIIEINEKSLE